MSQRLDTWHTFENALQQFIAEPEHATALVWLDLGLEMLSQVRDEHLLEAVGYGVTHAELAEPLGISRQAMSHQVNVARERTKKRRLAARKTDHQENDR